MSENTSRYGVFERHRGLLFTNEMEHLYPDISVPVKIIWGREDRWISLEKAEKL